MNTPSVAASDPTHARLLEVPLINGGRVLIIAEGHPTEHEIELCHRALEGLNVRLDRGQGLELPHATLMVEATEPMRSEPGSIEQASVDRSDTLDLDDDDAGVAELPVPAEREPADFATAVSHAIWPSEGRPNRGARILSERYGLAGRGAVTLQELATRLNVTRQRVQQIEAQVLGALRRDPTVREQAKCVAADAVRNAFRQMVSSSGFLPQTEVRSLLQRPEVEKGWGRLAVDIAIVADTQAAQAAALAGISLHRYAPFGVPGWVLSRERAEREYPRLESWAAEVANTSSRLATPQPVGEIAETVGCDVGDACTVLSAHPDLTVFAGYFTRGDWSASKQRAVRCHVLGTHLTRSKPSVGLHELWREYRMRFDAEDSCSPNDIRVALTDGRGAPHLFVVDGRKQVFFLGQSPRNHGLNLEAVHFAPEAEALQGDVGRLVGSLNARPERAESLATALDIPLPSITSTIQQRSNFLSVTPKHYWLVERRAELKTIDWKLLGLQEEDADDFIAARQAGVCPVELFPGWGPEFEFALCSEAVAQAWANVGPLLWASEPSCWPVDPATRSAWEQRKRELATEPDPIGMPPAARLSDPGRLLTLLLLLRERGTISPLHANRAMRPRGPRELVNCLFLAMLCRVGALDQSAPTHWALHAAGPRHADWLGLLEEEYVQTGSLSWFQGAGRRLLEEALGTVGDGWSSTNDWSELLRRSAERTGIELEIVIPEREASLAAGPDDGVDAASETAVEFGAAGLAIDLSFAVAQHDRGEANEEVAEAAQQKFAEDVVSELSSSPATPARPELVDRRNPEPVADLVELAANGNADAQYRLARQLEDGVGAATNVEAARRWLESASAAGHLAASVTLGEWLWTGKVDGMQVEARKRGLALLKIGVEKGHPAACYFMGLAFRDGDLVRRNPYEAVKLFKFSAKRKGYPPAFLELAKALHGLMHRWVPDTVALLETAAQRGVVGAQELLARAKAECERFS